MTEITLPPEEPRRSKVPWIAAAGAVLFILAVAYAPLGRRSSPAGTDARPHLPFGPAEEVYVAKIVFGAFTVSKAENFLHHEVTTFSVEAVNNGDRGLAEMEITLEFHDSLNQVVLRETRRILYPGAVPMSPGEHRTFEISFERLPVDWNMLAPAVHVTGLRFA
jgi:hypothetical protein